MLISAQYLDRDALLNYVATVEGGVRQTGVSRTKGTKGLGGSLGVGPAKVDATRDSESENTLSVEDHDASRLSRLIAAGHDDPEGLAWVEVMDPDTEFATIGLGAFVEWECDVYVPEVVAALSKRSGFVETLKQVQAIAPVAEALGLTMEGLPAASQMDAMRAFVENLDVAPVVIGDDSDTDWKVVGALNLEWIHAGASFDDRVRIIGKVKRRVGPDKWYPLFSLPGMNLLSREERRKKERHGPADSSEEANYVQGPLLVVEYLAIYS